MNGEQKRAWLAIISCGLCVVLFVCLTPFVGAKVATSAFGILGVNGFGVLIGRREKADERDRSIALRATTLGFVASYLSFCLALVGTWSVVFLLHGRSQVSVHALPYVVWVGFIVALSVRGVAVLIGYARHTEAEDV